MLIDHNFEVYFHFDTFHKYDTTYHYTAFKLQTFTPATPGAL